MLRILSRGLACGLTLLFCAGTLAQTESSSDGWTWAKAAHKVVSRKAVLPFVVPTEETGPWRGTKIEPGKLDLPLEGGQLRAKMKGSTMGLDLDGDLKSDMTISGKAKPVALRIKIDGKVVPYTMVFSAVRSALAIDTWFFGRTGCWREAKIGGAKVVLIDANGNGRYDDLCADFMVVGKRKHAQYLSKVISVGGKLFELKFQADGTRIGHRPYTGETGTLDLSKGFKMPKGKGKLAAAIVTDEESLSFDGSKAIVVPTGTYTLVWGAVTAGKKNRCQFKAKIEVEVKAGEVATASFGGPVKVTTQFSVDDNRKLEVLPDAVFLIGSAKENYFNFNPPLRLKIEIRDAKTKKVITRGGFSAG